LETVRKPNFFHQQQSINPPIGSILRIAEHAVQRVLNV
jgi:hypothetical protein